MRARYPDSDGRVVRDGIETKDEWLAYGSRTTVGNETKVVFGGQVMLYAKMRLDERTSPVGVDYLNLAGAGKGRLSLGVLEWIDDEACFLMASPGQPRPADTSIPAGKELISSLPSILKALVRRKVTPMGALKPHRLPPEDLKAVRTIYEKVEGRDQRYELILV